MKQAAMELVEQQGFEATSAVQIAERAGVTTRTFFRYFADKKEIFFADSEALNEALVEELLQAGDLSRPLRAVISTLAGHDWEKLGSREMLRRRSQVIASNPALLERDLIKQRRMADGLREALCERGIDPEIAELASDTGSQVFRMAYRRWLESGEDTDLPTIVENVVSLLAAVVTRDAAKSDRESVGL